MKKKSNTKNILCSALLLCSLCTLPVFAQDDIQYTDKALQESISHLRMDNLSHEYLMKVEDLLYKQFYNMEYDKALNTAQYFINASEKHYGLQHPRTGFAYIARARIYQNMFLFNKSILDLDIANSIYLKNPTDFDLANNVLMTYAVQYSSLRENIKAISILQKTLSKEYQYNGMYSVYGEIANAYTQSKNIKKALEYYDKKYEDLVENNLAISDDMFYHHLSLVQLYQTVGLHLKAAESLENAKALLSKLQDTDKKLLISFNKSKIRHLNEIRFFDEELALLSETEDLVKKYGDKLDKEQIKSLYIDLYKEKKVYSQSYKYFNDIEKIYSNLPKDSIAIIFPIYEKQIDLYKDMKNYDKSNEAVCNAFKKLQNQKEYAPAVYAYLLLKKFDINNEENKLDDAKIALDTAFEYYKNSIPQDSYEFYEVYKRYGQLNAHKGNRTEALKYFNKAKNINIPLLGEVNCDLADLYSDIANNSDNEKDAIEYINKSINIRKACYGDKHVKVYRKLINKYYIYNNFGNHEEAAKLLEQMNNDVNSKKITGHTASSIDFALNKINAYNALSLKDFNKAKILADNALKYATNRKEKQEVYELKYNIYSSLGNKIKAAKYKTYITKED